MGAGVDSPNATRRVQRKDALLAATQTLRSGRSESRHFDHGAVFLCEIVPPGWWDFGALVGVRGHVGGRYRNRWSAHSLLR